MDFSGVSEGGDVGLSASVSSHDSLFSGCGFEVFGHVGVARTSTGEFASSSFATFCLLGGNNQMNFQDVDGPVSVPMNGKAYIYNNQIIHSGGVDYQTFQVFVQPVGIPEPSTWALLTVGLVALYWGLRRRRREH
jgi:hypothetical protein